MTEHELRELQVRIARYRFLKRETTDPLAECLLDGIVRELEADLKMNDTAANRRSIPVPRMSRETTNSHTGTICRFFTLPMAAAAAATGGEYHED